MGPDSSVKPRRITPALMSGLIGQYFWSNSKIMCWSARRNWSGRESNDWLRLALDLNHIDRGPAPSCHHPSQRTSDFSESSTLLHDADFLWNKSRCTGLLTSQRTHICRHSTSSSLRRRHMKLHHAAVESTLRTATATPRKLHLGTVAFPVVEPDETASPGSYCLGFRSWVSLFSSS